MATKQNKAQTELFDLEEFLAPVVTAVETVEEVEPELEEVEPSAADLERIASSRELQEIVNGYSRKDFEAVMLAADTHTVGLSQGVAVERIYISKQAARRAEREARALAIAEREARNQEARELFESARETFTYRAMDRMMSELGSARGVVMTLHRGTVTVESLQWVKGEGDMRSTVARFDVLADKTVVLRFGDLAPVTVTEDVAVMALWSALPERSADLMPRKYRHVMRTHRHKNTAPVDPTGKRATRGSDVDALSAADVEQYNGLLLVEGPKLRTTGKASMQGVALTASERRESDRARLKLWRERKRAEKLAAAAAAAVEFSA